MNDFSFEFFTLNRVNKQSLIENFLHKPSVQELPDALSNNGHLSLLGIFPSDGPDYEFDIQCMRYKVYVDPKHVTWILIENILLPEVNGGGALTLASVIHHISI